MKDEPVVYKQSGTAWSPKNYGDGFSGPMTVKDAIKHSVNTIAVKTLDRVGIIRVIDTAGVLGIDSPLVPNLPLALGASEVTPLELASAYGVFATGGKKPDQVTPILKIIDNKGNILEDNTKPSLTEVISASAVSMLNYCLKAVVSGVTGAGAALPVRIVAGKTGTTSSHKDSWFVGYIPQLVTLVWVGNDNNSNISLWILSIQPPTYCCWFGNFHI